MNALLASKACDITGVVAIACARHGCYAPNSLVDLFLGEQQKNVDFGVIRGILLTHVDPEQGMLLYYDIICQYIVYFLERIGIHLPEGLQVDAAIGLFHVHAHKDDCFFRFASTFIPGSGVVAGEILESLWSSLNSISPSARTATLAHRAEILDDHATDSNHKKMLGIVSVLSKNHRKAIDMVDQAQEYYDNLTSQAGPIPVAKWRSDIEEAERCRVDNRPVMDIYAAKVERPVARGSVSFNQIDAVLQSWMAFALVVEDRQLKLRAKVRHLRRNPGNVDPQTIQTEREELTAVMLQLKQAQHTAGVAEPNSSHMSPPNSLDVWDNFAFDLEQTSAEIGTTLADQGPSRAGTSTDRGRLAEAAPPAQSTPAQSTSVQVPIEDQLIAIPSNGNASNVHRELELSHRIAMAEEQLNHVRNLIAEKSFQFSHVIRVSPRKGVTTRARAVIKKLNNQIAEHCRMYARCRSCLQTLGADISILSRFRVLNPVDVEASTVVLNPNIPGSTRIKLSWIWHTSAKHILSNSDPSDTNAEIGSVAETDAENVAETSADSLRSLLECMSLLYNRFTYFDFILVRRVHWLRARAQLMRWQEEVTLTSYEMQWTVRYYASKSKNWADIQKTISEDLNTSAGPIAYAKRKQSTWQQISVKSDRIFTVINNAYKSPL
jgi:Kyakuja-Dileera-Zisupton transposase